MNNFKLNYQGRLLAIFLIILLNISRNEIYSQTPTLNWAFNTKPLEGNVIGAGSSNANDVAYDASGNVFVTGSFYGKVDFDPGPGTAFLSVSTTISGAPTDLFLAKYSANGDYQWAFKIGSPSGPDEGISIAVDGSGNVYIAGSIWGSQIDFDPGPGTAILTSSINTTDIFLAKYNSNGDYQWAFRINGNLSGSIDVSKAALDASGNVYLTGSFEGTYDFDPSAATVNLNGGSNSDIFLAKYSSGGIYQWAFKIGALLEDKGNSIAIDGSGNIFLTGYFRSTVDFDPGAGTANLIGNSLSHDAFVAKYNSNGIYQWALAIGNSTDPDEGRDLAIDAAGNVYVIGFFSTADFDPGPSTSMLTGSSNDFFLACYSTNGAYLWAFALPAFGGNMGLALDVSGNIYVTGSLRTSVDFDPGPGTSTLSPIGSDDIYLSKYSSVGSYQWAFRIGSTSDDAGNNIAVDLSDNIFITGNYDITADFDPSPGTANLMTNGRAFFVGKYSTISAGYIWAISSYSEPASFETSNKILYDSSGYVYVTGTFEGTIDFDPGPGIAMLVNSDDISGNGDMFLAKYDTDGIYQWAVKIGSVGTDVGNSLGLDNSGNVYVTGQFESVVDFDPGPGLANLSAAASDIFLAKYNSNGIYQWAFKIGAGSSSNDNGSDLVIDASNNIYVTGYFQGAADFDPGASIANLTSSSTVISDAFLAKYSSAGSYQWAFRVGSSNTDIGYGVALDGAANVYLTGYFESTVDFDPGSGISNLTSAGNDEIFVAKYNENGLYQWAFKIGSTGIDDGKDIMVDALGNVYVTGTFIGTVDFDPGSGTANITSNNYDAFLAKYDANGTYQSAFRIGGSNSDHGMEIGIDALNNVYLSGSFNGTADFDPGTGTTNLSSGGWDDAFAAKYSSNGAYQWALQIGGINNNADIANSITIDGLGNLFVSGHFENSANFNSGFTLSNPGQTNFFASYKDAAKVNLSLSTNTVCELNAVNVIVTAALSGPLLTTQTINLIVSGTNITLSDYNLSGNTITIPPGQASGSVIFSAVNDGIIEGNETTVISINGISSGLFLGTSSQNIVVNDGVTPAVSIASNVGAVICSGASVKFTASPINGGSPPSYQWKLNGNNVGTNSNIYINSTLVNGDQVNVVMTSSSTCVTQQTANSNTIIITVNPNANAGTVAGSSSLCIGVQAAFTSNGDASGNWSSSNNLIATVNPTSGIVAGVGNGTVNIIYTVTSGCHSPITSSTSINVVSCFITLNLKAYFQGYYTGAGLMDNSGLGGNLFVTNHSFFASDADTVFISAMDPITHAEIDRKAAIIQVNGSASVNFSSVVVSGNSYYIKVNQRNSLETWSAAPVLMSAITNYDFTTAQSKAYGNNMVDVGTPLMEPSKWAFYSGDCSDATLGAGFQDGIIESQDYSDMENAVSAVLQGYEPEDITGDGIVESFDYSIMENNVYYVFFSMHP